MTTDSEPASRTAAAKDAERAALPPPPPTGAPPDRRGFGAFLRDELTSATPFTVTLLAFALALVLGGVLVILSDDTVRGSWSYFFARPGDALSASWTAVSDAYAALFKGAIVDPESVSEAASGTGPWTNVFYPISETLTNAAPLIFTGLSVALAFRAGLFNIGAEGQVVLGGIGAGLIGFGLHLPVVVHLIVALLGGLVGGALWGVVPGLLKARTGAHEVITTIMLNYVSFSLLVYLLGVKGFQDPNRSDAISKRVGGSAELPLIAGDPRLRVNLGIVLAILAAAGVAWLLQRSTIGFELRAVGASPDAARTAGMSVGAAYALAMALAGGLSGLGGASLLLGPAHTLTPAFSAQFGFDGITVALLGRARPWGVVLAGLLFGALRAGAVRMQGEAHIPVDMVSVLEALIVIFIAAPAFIKAFFRLRTERAARLATTLAKGW
jgi:general nucleoside transport system permease protein